MKWFKELALSQHLAQQINSNMKETVLLAVQLEQQHKVQLVRDHVKEETIISVKYVS